MFLCVTFMAVADVEGRSIIVQKEGARGTCRLGYDETTQLAPPPHTSQRRSCVRAYRARAGGRRRGVAMEA
jgi:hypothetical protein